MYTLQTDSNNNLIVCKADTVRTGYKIINSGSYQEMMCEKVRADSKNRIAKFVR